LAFSLSVGRCRSRTVIDARRIKKFVGAQEGNYDSVIFKTVFEKKNPTAQRVILIKRPVGWRITDYRIY
jgi:hypothetical protein